MSTFFLSYQKCRLQPLICTGIGSLGGFQSEWMADLIGIRTCAGKRAMEMQEVISRAIDGRVLWYHIAEILPISDACGAFMRLIPQINPQ